MTTIAAERTGRTRRATDTLVGRSVGIRRVREAVVQCGASPISVIITGPSGSGKEVVARAIHNAGPRARQPFVAVNCGAIPSELLESELFGHEKGAFSGAVAQRKGRFEEAHGGTIFLDEIGDMPLHMQVKLLRVLEDRTVQRVGGNGTVGIDVRVISATHRDIDAAIDAGQFREDLYYRLAVFPIELPALNQRPEDIALLIGHFSRVYCPQGGLTFDYQASRMLEDHDWPGNVRELRNLVERAALIYPGQCINAQQVSRLFQPRGRSVPVGASFDSAPETVGHAGERRAPPMASAAELPAFSARQPVDISNVLEQIERQYILDALEMADGVIAEASRLLGLQRTTLIGKINKYQLSRAA